METLRKKYSNYLIAAGFILDTSDLDLKSAQTTLLELDSFYGMLDLD